MSAPIKREDIRKGDKIRATHEFTANDDFLKPAATNATYELIERPVVLPTEGGLYLSSISTGGPWIFRLTALGEWWLINTNSPFEPWSGHLVRHAPFTLLRPVAEVAAEVLAEAHMAIEGSLAAPHSALDSIAIKFGVTE